MKIGFSLPNIGPIGTAEAVTKVAQRAEALGYNSLWTIERLLYPVKLQRPYPGTPDGSLPEVYRHTLDPLDALTYVAAHTKKIRLGTSVLDMPYHNPLVLARRLTTLDVLSNGRLCVGLGLGGTKTKWTQPLLTSRNEAPWRMNFCHCSKPFGPRIQSNFRESFSPCQGLTSISSRFRSRIPQFTWEHLSQRPL